MALQVVICGALPSGEIQRLLFKAQQGQDARGRQGVLLCPKSPRKPRSRRQPACPARAAATSKAGRRMVLPAARLSSKMLWFGMKVITVSLSWQEAVKPIPEGVAAKVKAACATATNL
ncbi:hypothetical protein QWZ10_08645 [Paracoccus cavernae]|uniref:Uncharacterized protein n=1 Tax=Paracoccus cavernae TaxID=1571207 RepID=A0ABT8D7J3_9RHOB|nr:hypothetical protein [Paracoccus cavernae]